MVSENKIPLQQLVKALLSNKAVVVQTDTVLGLLSLNEEQIIKIKKRNANTKKTVQFIGHYSWIEKEIPLNLKQLLNKYWPGPLTIVYKSKGYRIPDSKLILDALNEIKKPIYASSANISNQSTALNIKEAKEGFKDSLFEIEFIETKPISCEIKKASTVYDYDNKKILREGEITQEEIEFFIKE